MVEVEWGAEIYGGCPPCVDEDTPVMNKAGIEVPASCWMQEFEPYKLHANHAYYGNRAEPANDELAELRAFKEAAIAKHPDLASDNDSVQAERIAKDYGFLSLSDGHLAVARAFDYCRKNPR